MIASSRCFFALVATLSFFTSSQAQTNFYWSVGPVTVPNSWGTNLDGSGAHPSDFTTASQIFNIQNGQSASTSLIWTITGSGSGLMVQTGGLFTSSANNSLKLSMQSGASYSQSNSYAGTSSGTLDLGSTFVLNTVTFNPAMAYGGLTNIGSGTQSIAPSLAGAVSISGNLKQSGTGELQLTATTTGTFNIGRDFLVDTSRSLSIVPGSGLETINLTGNYANSGTVKSPASGTANFNFVGTGSSNVTFGTITAPMGTGTIKYSVASGKTVVFQDTLSTSSRVTLTNTGTIQLGTGGTTGAITGNFTNNGLLIVNRSDNSTLNGIISGSGSLQHIGVGTTTLTGINTFAGITTVNSGFIAINDERGLGQEPGSFTANQITLNGGGLQAATSSVDFSSKRGFTLGASGGTLDTNGQGFSINNIITGPGSLTKIGTSNLTLTAVNTYLGNTTVQNGEMTLYSLGGSSDNRLPTSTVLTLGSGANSAVLMLGNQTLNPDNPANQTLSGLVTNGTGTTNAVVGNTVASATLTITNSVANTFNGTIGGAGGNTKNLNVVKSNSGTLTLNGNDTYTGTTTINGGTLLVNGTHSSSGIYTVNASTLGGTGTINADVNVIAGALAPGNSLGRLTINGNVTFSSTSSFNIEINGGATAGVDYDQLRVGAGKTLTLNGATLNIILGFVPNGSEKIFLTDNLFSGGINGTFAGLSEGSLITIGDYTANISYLGDFPSLGTFGGNDFVLYNFITTAVPEPGTYALLLLTGFFALQWYLRRKTTEDKKSEEKPEGVPTESVPMEVASIECEC